MRMTKQRKLIFDYLEKNRFPSSAEMIFNNLKVLDLSTVYRTLDLFFQNNMVLKSTIHNINYYYLNDKHHHHYLICENCHKMVPIDCILGEEIKNIAKTNNFKITHHDLTVYGLCSECNTK
jgi:Fur family ferric uptake transcriptional regulator